MKSIAEIANGEIVKALASGQAVVWSKVNEFYVVTIEPFQMAYVLSEKQVYFNLERATKNEKLTTMFTNLLDLEKTMVASNMVTPTGTYFAAFKDFLKEYGGEQNKVLLKLRYTKDLDSRFPTFYQESPETAEKKDREGLPVLMIVDRRPVRIIVPARKVC